MPKSRAYEKTLTKHFSARFTEDQFDALATTCKRLGVDKSTFIRLATIHAVEALGEHNVREPLTSAEV